MSSRLLSKIFFVLSFTLPGLVWAGLQLSPTELVKRSSAIAEISVQWDTKKNNTPTITIQNWVKKPNSTILQSLQQQPEQIQKWLGLCLPDASLLKHWVKTYPHFEKDNINLWKRALSQGQYKNLLFFRPHPATQTLSPTCETESLLVQNWKMHPQFTQYLKTVTDLVEVAPLKKPAEPQTKKPAKPAAQPTPAQKKGCTCNSSQ